MQGPYRPQAPPPDPELARLAMEGQRRRMEVAAGQRVERQAAGGNHLRTAIGAYRGSLIKRIVLVALIGGVMSGALGVTIAAMGWQEIGHLLTPGFFVAFICIFGMAFIPPIATQSAIAAEQSWSMALPFQLIGYFEVLSAEPQGFRTVTYEIAWRDGVAPDPNLLHGIIGAVDPQARIAHADARSARITSGPISGVTGIRVNRVPVYRNHKFCKSIHAVVEQVLLPLHRTYPIAHVAVT